jgi:crotonobetainyl-CoA:carnitine CoA-transferase CaiB-like acyl-CoA transferase
VQVVELESGPAAAYAGRLLTVLGARVTKFSFDAPHVDPATVAFDSGKALLRAERDLAKGAAEVERLALAADVVLIAGEAAGDLGAGRKAGSAFEWPIAFQRWRTANPGLITAAIMPFGESGPKRNWRGSDLIAVQSGGLGHGTPPRVVDPEREHPLGIPGDATALLTGQFLAIGILHALAERDGDGLGRHVEVSAQEAVAALMFNNIGELIDTGVVPTRLAKDRPNARRPFIGLRRWRHRDDDEPHQSCAGAAAAGRCACGHTA